MPQDTRTFAKAFRLPPVLLTRSTTTSLPAKSFTASLAAVEVCCCGWARTGASARIDTGRNRPFRVPMFAWGCVHSRGEVGLLLSLIFEPSSTRGLATTSKGKRQECRYLRQQTRRCIAETVAQAVPVGPHWIAATPNRRQPSHRNVWRGSGEPRAKHVSSRRQTQAAFTSLHAMLGVTFYWDVSCTVGGSLSLRGVPLNISVQK